MQWKEISDTFIDHRDRASARKRWQTLHEKIHDLDFSNLGSENSVSAEVVMNESESVNIERRVSQLESGDYGNISVEGMKHTLQLIDTLIETGDETTFIQIFFDNSFTLNKPDKEQDCNCSEDDDDSNSNNAKILTDIENFMMSSPVQIERSWINKYFFLKNYKSTMSNYAQSQPLSSWKHY